MCLPRPVIETVPPVNLPCSFLPLPSVSSIISEDTLRLCSNQTQTKIDRQHGPGGIGGANLNKCLGSRARGLPALCPWLYVVFSHRPLLSFRLKAGSTGTVAEETANDPSRWSTQICRETVLSTPKCIPVPVVVPPPQGVGARQRIKGGRVGRRRIA